MKKQIETIVDKVGIRGVSVEKGTKIDVYPDAAKRSELGAQGIREGVAKLLILNGRAKLVKPTA